MPRGHFKPFSSRYWTAAGAAAVAAVLLSACGTDTASSTSTTAAATTAAPATTTAAATTAAPASTAAPATATPTTGAPGTDSLFTDADNSYTMKVSNDWTKDETSTFPRWKVAGDDNSATVNIVLTPFSGSIDEFIKVSKTEMQLLNVIKIETVKGADGQQLVLAEFSQPGDPTTTATSVSLVSDTADTPTVVATLLGTEADWKAQVDKVLPYLKTLNRPLKTS